MEYSIEKEYPVLRIKLDRGESLLTGSGNLSWMTMYLDYDAQLKGGLMGGIKRSFAKADVFLNTYTATQDNQEIAFASALPGEIVGVVLDQGDVLYAQKSAFLASDVTIYIDAAFTKKLTTGLFGGEGFILQKITGHGNVFLASDGSLIEYTLKDGESLKVDQGHLFMYDASVAYELTRIKGVKNVLFGGEGLLMAKLTGPGKVYLQTLPISKLAGQLKPYFPSQSSSGSSSNGINITLG